MEAIMPLFPLYSLPKDAVRNVLLTMDFVDILAFSFCSKNSKNRVSSLQIPAERVNRCIDHRVSFVINIVGGSAFVIECFNSLTQHWKEGDAVINMRNLKPDCVRVNFYAKPRDRPDVRIWKNSRYTYHGWADHLFNLFKLYGQDLFTFYPGSERFDVFSLRRAVQGQCIVELIVNDLCLNRHHQRIHRAFHPLKSVTINRVPFSNRLQYHRFLIQNFDDIDLRTRSLIGLDEMLLLNSFSPCIFDSHLADEKSVNRFLKLWTKGIKPRLEYLFFRLSEGNFFHVEEVLKGVKYQILPKEREQNFANANRELVLRGGFEIRSRTGKRANIILVPYNNPRCLQMCVFS